MIFDKTFSEKRGWIYGISYSNLQQVSGGVSFWWNENHFKRIENPIVRQFARRIELKENIQTLKKSLQESEEELNKISYSLKYSVDDWESVKKICSCGICFVINKRNPNSDLCEKCFKEK